MTIYTDGPIIGGPINLSDIVPQVQVSSGWFVADLIVVVLAVSVIFRLLLACKRGGHLRIGLSDPLGRAQRIGIVVLIASVAVLLAYVVTIMLQDFAYAQAEHRRVFMNATFSTGRTAEYRSALKAIYDAAIHREVLILLTAAAFVIGNWLVFIHRATTDPLIRWLKDG